MTMMNWCDMEVAQAYHGLYFPLEKKKRKEKKERKKGLGKINKIIWGSTNGLPVKSFKVKPNVD